MSKIDTPIDRGFIIKNMLIARDVIIKESIRVIYSYESGTHSSNLKCLRALYTNLYKLFINKCISIGRFIQHLQNVSIRLLLRIRSGGERKSGERLLG